MITARPFPTTYADIPTATLVDTYAAAPERYRTALAGLTAEQLLAHPRPGKWSICEVVVHVADSEIMGAARFRQALSEPGATCSPYDQDKWANGLHYVNVDKGTMEVYLSLFAGIRSTTTKLLRAATAEDWKSKYVNHPEWSTPYTLRNLVEAYADHGERHLGQILEMRKLLGVPHSLKLLLEKRVY